MPNQHLGDILQKLSSSCTFPVATELEDTTCHVCLHDSLGPQGSEIPVGLCCGHILGMACLVTWASDSFAAGRNPPTCPICRTPFFLPSPTEASPPETEADETTPEERGHWYMFLNTFRPGRPVFLEGEEWWIARAEQLWIYFRNAIYDHIDAPVDPAQGAMDLVQDFLGEKVPDAQYILSYATVYNFFVAFRESDPLFRAKLGSVREWIPEESARLIDHLQNHNDVDSQNRWRIRQGCGVEFAARMERRRSRLRLHLDQVSPEWRSHVH
ncbi:MAG: hypothetical protein Q9196_005880 [Gyalolechia fulgens]